MGIDFRAFLDHSLEWDRLYRLPALLESRWRIPSALPELLSGLNRDNSMWRWDPDLRYSNPAEELFEEGFLSMTGPAGFFGSAFRSAVALGHVARWWSFVYEPEVHLGLREATRRVAAILGSTTIIYAPDSFHPTSQGSDILFDGGSFSDVVTWFEKEIGRPAADRLDLRAVDEETNALGYLVERVDGAV